MRKLIPLLFIIPLAFPALVRAQGGDDHREGPPEEDMEPSADKYAEKMERALGLDAKQKAAVRKEAEESFKRSKSKREEMKALRDKMKEAGKGLQQEMRRLEEGVREHLTIEQKDKFDAIRMRMRMRGAERGERREERREIIKERFKRGSGGREGPGGDEVGPGRFPPEMWHEHGAPGGGPPPGRRGPSPDDQPPGAPPEPGGD